MFCLENIYLDLSFESWQELFCYVGKELFERGIVKESYTSAIIERENLYPTGLPIPNGVAIPHTDPEHVIKPCIVVCKFHDFINFKEMGMGENDIQCKFAFFLVVNRGEEQVELLQNLISMFTKDEAMENMIKCESKELLLEEILKNI